MLYTDEAIKKRKQREKKIKNIVNIIVYIILIPLLIYNISLIIQSVIKPQETPSFLGIKTYVIISGSMQPNLKIGDIVVVRNAENYEEGDIISFRQGQSVITHRISEVIESEENKEYKTKGDNNNTEDSGTIREETIEGKVVGTIPLVGKIALMLRNKIVIIVVLIGIYINLSHSKTVKEKKEQRRAKRMEYDKRRSLDAKVTK